MKKGTFWSAAAIAATLVGAAPAQAALLYEQTAGQVGSDSVSSAYVAPNAHLDNQGADDFVVPPGFTWTIDRVDVNGSLLGQPVANQINVFIYGNAGTLPGTEIFRQLAIVSANGPDFEIALTGAPALQPGRYWVSPQYSFGVFPAQQWLWARSNITTGNPAAWRGPEGGPPEGCDDWSVRQVCLTSLEPAGPDQIFSLHGIATAIPNPPIPDPSPTPEPVIPPSCEGVAATIIAVEGVPVVGSAGDDVILGTTGTDVIDGGDGDDLICGRDGDDVIDGGAGDDLIRGFGGADSINAGDGADRVNGGFGDDVVGGFEGADHLSGRLGDDVLRGGLGDDELHGNRGADQLGGDEGEDTCHGADGIDSFDSCELGTGRLEPLPAELRL